MQLHIDFTTNDVLNLPTSYNSIVQGFIYNALSCADPSFSDCIHNKGKDQNVDLFKMFTFGRLYGNYKIIGHEILFSRDVSLEIRSPDERIIQNIMRGCSENDTVKLGTNRVKVKKIRVTNKIITEDVIHAFCLSPFVYKISFEECNSFHAEVAKEKILNNACQKWLCAGHDASSFALNMEFIGDRADKVHCMFKRTFINAWNTPFSLCGNPQVIDFLYNTGIGSRNSQGFGMFEVAK